MSKKVVLNGVEVDESELCNCGVPSPCRQNVVFTGCSEHQQRWGGYADHSSLAIGEWYEVEHVVVHDWNTDVYLVGCGGPFNSVCFDAVNGR